MWVREFRELDFVSYFTLKSKDRDLHIIVSGSSGDIATLVPKQTPTPTILSKSRVQPPRFAKQTCAPLPLCVKRVLLLGEMMLEAPLMAKKVEEMGIS